MVTFAVVLPSAGAGDEQPASPATSTAAATAMYRVSISPPSIDVCAFTGALSAQCRGGRFVGGKERFDAQRRGGQVQCGAERRDGAQECQQLSIGGVQLERHRDAAEIACLVETPRIRLDLSKQRGQLARAADRGLAPKPLDEVMAPLTEIADSRCQPLGVDGDAQCVRPLEQVRCYAVEQHP